MFRVFCLLALVSLQASPVALAEGISLEQIISREDPRFVPAQASLSVGKDGRVYLGGNGPDGTAYVLRLTTTGQEKFGAGVTYALTGATANRDGLLATSHGHFAHQVVLHDPRFQKVSAVSDFLVGDHVGYDAPAHVEAGESGDFYALDKHRDRMLRINPEGKVIQAYPLPREPAGNEGMIDTFRLAEKQQAFYLIPRQGPLRVVGFDGQTRWTTPHRVGMSHLGYQGGFDVDAEGNLYVIEARSNRVVKLNSQGQPAGEIALQIPDFAPSPHGYEGTITGLRLAGNDLLLKRWDATRLFECYDLTTGAFKQFVPSAHERLTVSYPTDVWTAGEAVDFTIRFDSGTARAAPRWRVWIRSLQHVDYRELPLENGRIQVPADLGGICQIKVTPEVQPWERGGASEYLVRGWVEVRAPGALGSVSVLTFQSRIHYGRGEEIPFTILARSRQEEPIPVSVGLYQGDTPLATAQVTATPGQVLSLNLPTSFTAALRPGAYRLQATGAGLTSVPQPLIIGPGSSELSFLRMRHGDYGPTYPEASLWNAPDVVAAQLARERKLGFNLFVDRIGTHLQIGALQWDGQNKAQMREWITRLENDPTATDPDSLKLASPLLQLMAAYGANDLQQMAILLYMDAGLPLGGPGHDPRPPEKLAQDLQTVTKALTPYPAFRGWSWHSNWWIYGQRGSAAAASPEQKAEYEAALKRAQETGAWSPVLEQVSDRRLGFAVEAQELFRQAMLQVNGSERLKTATAGTYRNVEAYPPISFQNVEEVDLQGQFEQIFLPSFPQHAVDFYRRPGKPVWGHPEVWNDAGTGEQILPELFSMLMRSPDGIGLSGKVPPWTGQSGIVEDPRLSHFGTASVVRALNRVCSRYGAWIGSLETADQVAIVASGRQFKIDDWSHVAGVHFGRVMEAYVSCYHAHHPASIVFAEDLQPESLTRFKAVLVVDQWVEPEPMLKTALRQAQAAGAKVFYDGTCRESLLTEFTPLGLSFNQFDKDRHPASDDAAYHRFPQYVRNNLPVLIQALDAVATPPARLANPEVLLSELRAEQGRYLFVVNNTSVPLEPGQMWRTTLHVASLLPVVEAVQLTKPPAAVYDVFALKQVTPENNMVTAELRTLPARLYALLPAEIASVELRGPRQVAAGQKFPWQVRILDSAGQPIPASIPLQFRLLDQQGALLQEGEAIATSAGSSGELIAPINLSGAVTLEVSELFSGKTARLSIQVIPTAFPIALPRLPLPSSPTAADTLGTPAQQAIQPTEQDFGPHLRDMVLTDGGSTAVINAMNWDQNLYAIDTQTGEIRWRNKLGHWFAFAPQSLESGCVVQAFDHHTAEGYHLYRLDSAGRVDRRYALYGLPRRLPHRFVPGLLNDREQPVNNFAAAPDGSWIASAGDLGLALWSGQRQFPWQKDYWKSERRPARIAALDNSTLLVAEGLTLTAHEIHRGRELWKLPLGVTGKVRELVVSRDGQTVAALTTSDGGRIVVIRNGQAIQTLMADAEDIEISGDGRNLVAVSGHQLRWYTLEHGLRWTFSGDDRLRNPRLSLDGTRVAVSSELGTVTVLDAAGELLWEQDHHALTVPAWMPDGDLLLANWMGRVRRLDARFQERWNVLLHPAATDVRAALTAQQVVPTNRMGGWGNASPEPLPLQPNLLTETKAIIRFVAEGANHVQLVRQPTDLTDGSPQPPAEPWLDWGDLNWFAEANPLTYLQLDTFRTRLRVEAITFVEDPAWPDSWLRDALLERWDAEREQWVAVQPLLSDAAVHTHRLPQPVEATRLRVVIPRGFYGNLRLAEIVLHGETLGAAHPDVVAKRPVAVLFDESEEFRHIYPYHDRWSFQLQDAFAGGRFLQVNADQIIAPAFVPVFGHAVPDWDLEIAKNPQPGQYRWAQWSWKALSPETKGATLQLGNLRLHAGTVSGEAHLKAHQVAVAPPGEWQTVRVDLWELLKQPARIQTMYLGAAGGPVGFDQVLLGRTQADLDRLTSSAK